MPIIKIEILTITPLGILIVFRDRLWQFRVLSPDCAIYGHTRQYYTLQAAEKAGREWVGAGW